MCIRDRDDHGFLAFSEREGSRLLKIPVKQYRVLRKQLMELEPEGIGCVSMGEYFLFQLMKKGIHVPDAFRDLCMNHLEDITEMTFVQIAHMIHASFQEVKRWVRVLGTLKPYPIRDSGEGCAVETVIPDILIVPRGGGLEVRVNDYYMRQYCVSDFYRRTMKDEDNEEPVSYTHLPANPGPMCPAIPGHTDNNENKRWMIYEYISLYQTGTGYNRN